MKFAVLMLAPFGLLLASVARSAEAPVAPADGPLAKYVAKADASYKWAKRRAGKVGQADYVELILTSQTWHDVVWKHQLFLIRPSTVAADAKHGLLFITGGRWNESLEKPAGENEKLPKEAPLLVALAEQLKTPIAILAHVPQQPILGGKVEDDAIAETFVNFMKTGESDWPLLLPMVKSAVRGMDATQAFAKQEWKLDLKTFTITGASKRGWTTWLTGATDARATAIAPMVIDMLNMSEQMKLQVKSFGKPSDQIIDYTKRGLEKFIDSPQGKALNLIVDPYSYRKKLTQPKLLLLGTNDPYWPLEALNLYWDDLEGEKYVLYVPNNVHGLTDLNRVAGTLGAFHRRMIDDKPLPKLTWKLDMSNAGFTMSIASDVAPKEVHAWIATSATRDFRQSHWTSTTLEKQGDGYTHRLPMPATGYAAMFGEAVYDGPDAPFYLSTNLRMIGLDSKPAAAAAGK
jgi:PhoPQ-activated pathogenicity-related protein